RYYDPTIGRFLSRDPLTSVDPAGHRSYLYASDNPARYTDPSGLMDLSGIDWSDFTPSKRSVAPKHEDPNGCPGCEGKPQWQFPNGVPGVDNWPGPMLNAILAQLRNLSASASSDDTTPSSQSGLTAQDNPDQGTFDSVILLTN